jgi:hypothetical protein
VGPNLPFSRKKGISKGITEVFLEISKPTEMSGKVL